MSASNSPLRVILKTPLYWLLLAMPAALAMEYAHVGHLWIFVASCVAIIPLAGLMGRATENLAETLGSGIGGLLNATFGNAAELIIALMALWQGPAMYPLVKASLTGSIIGNVLLVLGLSMVCGGTRYSQQTFNRTAASMGATLLALATIGLIIPTLYYYAFTSHVHISGSERHTIALLSEEIAVVMAIVYGLSLLFTLGTHRNLYSGEEESREAHHHQPEWNRTQSLVVLGLSTVGVAIMSELLIGSVTEAGEALGMTSVFVGVIVVAIVGNAAEHSTAVLVAMKNKMDLSVNIAIGSSIQIALFVAPVLVLASMLLHEEPLDLHFTLMEMIAVIISIAVLSLVCQDGECHWLEGAMLLAVYALLGLAFYHLPEPDTSVEGAKSLLQLGSDHFDFERLDFARGDRSMPLRSLAV